MAAAAKMTMEKTALLPDSDPASTEKRLWKAIEECLQNRQTAIKILKRLKTRVEKSYNQSRIARFAGILFAFIAHILVIVACGLLFAEEHEIVGLYASGSILEILGAVIICGAEIGYAIVARCTLSNSDIIRQIDQEKIKEIQRLENNMKNQWDALNSSQFLISKDVIKKLPRNCLMTKPLARAAFSVCHILASIADVCASTLIILSTASNQNGVSLWMTVVKVAIWATVCNGALVPLDLMVMIKSVYDVLKYTRSLQSNSTAGAVIGGLIAELEIQNDRLKSLGKDGSTTTDLET